MSFLKMKKKLAPISNSKQVFSTVINLDFQVQAQSVFQPVACIQSIWGSCDDEDSDPGGLKLG